MFKIVEFQSENATLRGRLYFCPEPSKKLPIIIMAHGFSATINGMIADNYAEAFCQAGFAVLLYDHRNFSISDDEPCLEINIWVQARGYRDAIDYVTSLPQIDATRIALWSNSLSISEAFVVGAIDQRVKAIIAQVPDFGDDPPPSDPDGTLFTTMGETFQHGDVSGTPETNTEREPVVSFDQAGIPSLLLPLTAYRWFIEYGGWYDTNWQNWASIDRPVTPVPFEAIVCAPHLQAALLMVIARDDELDGGHFGLLHYPSSLFDEASRAQLEFLKKWL